MKKIAIILSIFAAATSLEAQTITLGQISPLSYCVGSTIEIPYQASGTFASDNYFFVELSNANGSFTSFTSVGNNSLTSGSISVTLGSTGFHFHVKVASTDPYIESDSNENDIQVLSDPSPDPYPNYTFALIGDTIHLSDNEPTGTTFEWTFNDTDASIHASQISSPSVVYSIEGTKTGSLVVTNSAGCTATTHFTFYILSCNPTIPYWQNVYIVSGTGSASDASMYPYVWVRAGGTLPLDGDFPEVNQQTIFVEPGATIEGENEGQNFIFYIKAGASVKLNLTLDEFPAAVLDSGLDSIATFNFYCPDLTFDYSQVFAGVSENPPPSNLTILQSGDHLFANADGLPIRNSNLEYSWRGGAFAKRQRFAGY